ncbi:hypothetical protein AB0J28_19305 [Streptosporangium canum]|uniref:hypothetical protein n=1 Tax=Streptosporangium canum TaxID=324952 RepID=UPI0034385DFE
MTKENSDFPTPSITSEASRYLDQQLEGLRDKVIQIAVREKAVDSRSLTDITASDIAAALIKLNIARESIAKKKLTGFRARRFFVVYVAVLSVISPLLLGYVINSASSLAKIDAEGSVLAALAALAALGSLLAAFYAYRNSQSVYKESEALKETVSSASDESYVLLSWAHLEQAMRKYVAEQGGEIGGRQTLSRVIQQYVNMAQLSAEEHGELKRILQVRNQIAHFPASGKDSDVIRDAVPLVRKHLRRIRGSDYGMM